MVRARSVEQIVFLVAPHFQNGVGEIIGHFHEAKRRFQADQILVRHHADHGEKQHRDDDADQHFLADGEVGQGRYKRHQSGQGILPGDCRRETRPVWRARYAGRQALSAGLTATQMTGRPHGGGRVQDGFGQPHDDTFGRMMA